MSRIREQLDTSHVDETLPAETDLTGYVVFTQLKKDGPFLYAGWLDAADAEMAVDFAIRHYGRDQKCVNLWVAQRAFVGGMRINEDRADQPVDEPRAYQLFTQQQPGDPHESSIIVTARSASKAIELGRAQLPGGADELHNIWAIPVDELHAPDPDTVIWPYTDQTYRLARGYSKDVREKWETIRADRDIDEYEKEDLKDTF